MKKSKWGVVTLTFTVREADTILAALRRHQARLEDRVPDEFGLDDIARCRTKRALGPKSIDDLCDEINQADVTDQFVDEEE